METPELPPELREIERVLSSRAEPAADAGSRARILARVKGELADKGGSRGRWSWGFGLGLAASILICLNVSTSATNNTDWKTHGTRASGDRAKLVEQLREVLPELSDADVQRCAVLVHR